MKKREILEYMKREGLDTIELKRHDGIDFYKWTLRDVLFEMTDDGEFYLTSKSFIKKESYGKSIWVSMEVDDESQLEKIEQIVREAIKAVEEEEKRKEHRINELEVSIQLKERKIESQNAILNEVGKEIESCRQTVSWLFEESIRLKKDIEIKKAKIYKTG